MGARSRTWALGGRIAQSDADKSGTVRVRVISAILCFLVGGCRLISDCTYETRYVSAAGAITENGSDLVRALVTVGANKGSLTWKDFDRTITGSPLVGHVLAIRLVRSDQPGVSLLDIPIDQNSGLISSGSMIQRPADETPNLAGLYELVAAGLAVLELDTDLPSYSHLSIPLMVSDKRDWYRPSNCY